MFERRLYYHIDWAMLAAILVLCGAGLAMIYSTSSDPTRGASRLSLTQLYAIVLGLGALVLTLTVDYRAWADKSHLIYVGLLALLVYVLLFGAAQNGARRWIPLGLFNLQPSEFAKVGVALVLAKLYGDNRGAPGWTDLAVGGLLTLVPLLLIAKEPDLGTAVTLVPVFVAVAYLAGMRMRILGLLGLCLLLSAPVAWKFALQDYQRSRISTFLDPAQDARGAGYQQIQAQITVGSGGLWGKGFKQGTQGQLRFLPVAHNDFIFSVIAEEKGFLGSIAVLGLFGVVLWNGLRIAGLARDRFGTLLAIGVTTLFAVHVFVNIAMTIGLVPITGIPLPFISYGGSFVLSCCVLQGLVQSVYRFRKEY